MRVFGVVMAVGILSACSGSTSPSTPVESSLVAAGYVLDRTGAPLEDAMVHVQTLYRGKAGGDFGCTGAYLTGDWFFFTPASGRFVVDMRMKSLLAPVCIVVLSALRTDTVWRDTAAVVAPFKPVREGVAPDTVRFELRLSPF